MRKLLKNIDEKIERIRHNLENSEIALDHGIGNDYQVALFRARIEVYQEVKGMIAERLAEQLEERHA